MSHQDDTCDFCNRYVDPMGGDTSRVLDDHRYWCGQCREGRYALYGHMSDEEIRTQIAHYEKLLRENPIWPDLEDSDDFKTHLKKIDAQDRIAHLKELLKERQQQRPD